MTDEFDHDSQREFGQVADLEARAARVAELEAERERCLDVLAPSVRESGLEDACRQVKQAAISEAQNAEALEAEVLDLRTKLAAAEKDRDDYKRACHTYEGLKRQADAMRDEIVTAFRKHGMAAGPEALNVLVSRADKAEAKLARAVELLRLYHGWKWFEFSTQSGAWPRRLITREEHGCSPSCVFHNQIEASEEFLGNPHAAPEAQP